MSLKKKPIRFSAEEDKVIVSNYKSMPNGELAQLLGRGIIQVRKRAAKLGVSSPARRWTKEEDASIKSLRGNVPLVVAAEKLGRSTTEVSTRSKKLGFGKWRVSSGRHAGRLIIGFKSGKPVYQHRDVVEKHIGRALKSDEIVHHINFDKDDNSLANLHVFGGRAAHRTAHMSFENVVPILMQKGILTFDRSTGLYALCLHKL
jgi:hypothetical protein